ncbi:hypothetical protein KJ693_11455, partial [bacterium]|nr:hypothetical protein [bacterium]
APVVSTDSVVHTLIGYDSFGNKMVYADDTNNWRYLDGSLALEPALTTEALDTSRTFNDAGWTKLPTGSVTINGAQFHISNYSTVDNFVDAINSNSQAGVTLSYSEMTDKWTFTPLHQGQEFTMSETPANSSSVGFFTANNFLVDKDGKIEVKEEVAKILFKHLFNPQDPTELNFRWMAVDAQTYDQVLPTFISKREVIDCMETLNLSASAKQAFEKEKPTGTITINNYTSNDISSYDSLQQLVEEINSSEAANATISYDPVNDRFTLVSKSAAAALTTSETYSSSNGAVVSGYFLDEADAFGKIDGTAIGKVDGVITSGRIRGRSAGLAIGNVESAVVTGELIGYIEGKFDGEGIFSGDVKKYNGYIKGDVSALDGVTDVLSPTNNAWIDGTIKGSALGILNGTMVGFLDTSTNLNGVAGAEFGDFRVNGHIYNGYAQADTGSGGIYGEIMGDAGIFNATNIIAGVGLAPVTITGPGTIQGAVGGDYISTLGRQGSRQIFGDANSLVVAGNVAIPLDNTATLNNVTVNGAVMGTLNGTGTGTLYTLTGGVWVAGTYGTHTFSSVGTQALVGPGATFTGNITGVAQGNITLGSTGTITNGVVTGIQHSVTDMTTDVDGNGVADALITINSPGRLIGDFEGQIHDIYGEIYQDEDGTTADADWVSAMVNVSGWAYAYFDSIAAGAGGYFTGTLDGEAHGEIWGLVKHAAVVAQHFEGIGYTAFDHGNIKFEGTFTGRANDADDHDLPDAISNIIENLAQTGAIINGIVDGLLDVRSANQYFTGACSGIITATAAGA